MRALIAGSLLSIALIFPAAAGEFDADGALADCARSGNENCQYQRQVMTEQWPAALDGNYLSQRNVAFCLSDGCYGAVRVDPVMSCAWRMVILGSDNPALERGDEDNFVNACRLSLSADQQTAATAKAQRLFILIYGRRLPTFAP